MNSSYGLRVALETGTGMDEKPVRRRTHCAAVNRGASRRAVLRIAIPVLIRGTSTTSVITPRGAPVKAGTRDRFLIHRW